jgi:hypothetical protein
MKTIWRILSVLTFLANITPCQMSEASELAATPPMGWNSWNSFGRTINETTVRQTAEKVSTELKRFGWEYIVIDEGWYISNPLEQDASKFQFVMTEDGRPGPKTGTAIMLPYSTPAIPSSALTVHGRTWALKKNPIASAVFGKRRA